MQEFDEDLALAILDSREEKSRKQRELLDSYKTSLISYGVNSPGIYKDSQLYNNIFMVGYEKILDILRKNDILIVYAENFKKKTGPEGYLAVDAEASLVKRLMCEIENKHRLGRILDIDVFDKNFRQLSRTEIGLEKRSCLICDQEARSCIRTRRHSYDELVEKIEKDWKEYLKLDP